VRRWFKTPPNVARQIRQFDRDRSKVKPFTFTLDPEQAVKVKPVAQQSAEVLARRAARPRSTGTGKPLAHRPQAA
jgi:hypothetical protein